MDVLRQAVHPRDIADLNGAETPSWLTPDAVERVATAEDRPFDDAEYAGRLDRVRHRMARIGVDALVVFRPSSTEYLCGYHTAETAPQPWWSPKPPPPFTFPT